MSHSGIRSLFAHHIAGLATVENGSGRQMSKVAVAVVYGVPSIVAILVAITGTDLSQLVEGLFAGYGLACGVLIAVFTQLAGWRERLDSRRLHRPLSEAAARRALHAAVAHSLIGVTAAVVAVAAAVGLGLRLPGSPMWNALAAGSGTYVGILVLLIVRSAYTGYMSTIDGDGLDEDDELIDPVKYARARGRID